MPKQRKKNRASSKLMFKPIQLMIGAVALAVIAVIVLIAISQFSARGPQEASAPNGAIVTAKSECPNLISGYTRTMGSLEAPVQFIEFSDFQCPVCGRFARDYEARMIKNFVCTGKVRFTYKDFAFIGPESKLAAQAANCATDQGKFWEYHDKLFASQRGENRGNFSEKRLKGFARDLKLDMGTFSQCLDSGKYATQVQSEFQEGKKRGVNATPTFFLDGKAIRGLPASYDVLSRLLKKALSNQ